FFARLRSRTARSRGLSFAGSRLKSGSLFRTDARISDVVSPEKVGSPVSISYKMQPNENTSLRASTAKPFACSGDMYAAVPRITPAFVATPLSVGEFD